LGEVSDPECSSLPRIGRSIERNSSGEPEQLVSRCLGITGPKCEHIQVSSATAWQGLFRAWSPRRKLHLLLKLRRTFVSLREAEITVTGQELCAEEHAKGAMTAAIRTYRAA
jgi:hypothetical protein